MQKEVFCFPEEIERFLIPFHVAIKKIGKDTIAFKALY